MKLLAVFLFTVPVMGCSFTSLKCGVNGDSSYLELVTNQDVSSQIRNYKDICNAPKA